MKDDKDDLRIQWMTERELYEAAKPPRWLLAIMAVSPFLGIAAAQLLWWWLG